MNAQQSKRFQLLLLSIGALLCGIGFSTLQERVFRIEGFAFGGWMGFLTYLSWIILSFLEMAFRGAQTRHASLKSFALVSLFSTMGVYFTNWSLTYLNYATRVIVKSCKVLPVMILRVIISRKHYGAVDYFAATTLATGIYFYMTGDKQVYPEYNGAGLALIAVALVCDALTSNLEERWFFSIPTPCSNSEIVHYLAVFSCPLSFTLISYTGEIFPAVQHSIANPIVVPLIFTFSILGYIGVEFVLLIVQHFGATKAEIVKSLRRVLQVTFSFILFPKPVTMKHLLGGCLVSCSLVWFEFGQRRKAMNK